MGKGAVSLCARVLGLAKAVHAIMASVVLCLRCFFLTAQNCQTMAF